LVDRGRICLAGPLVAGISGAPLAEACLSEM
jgi:hypothetical protein